MAYSGAEDIPTLINGVKHFGGEVMTDGNRAISGSGVPSAHTGLYSVQLAAGQKLKYQVVAGTDVLVGKPYRLSAWVHASDLPVGAGRLYASVNGNVVGENSIAALETKKAGAWYRLMLNVTIPAGSMGQTVEFGCRNASNSGNLAMVYVDDFRVCPLTATMNSQVYDSRTNRLTDALDNENLFTHYQYNPDGRLYRIYKESFDRPGNNAPAAKLVKEYAYNYARNASYTVSVTGTGAPAGSTVSPASPVSVLIGERADFTLTSSDCSYILEPAFLVDGVSRNGTCTLSDNTRVVVNGTQVSVQNVRGSHNIIFSYQRVVYPTAGTEASRVCEVDNATGCNTGRVLRYLADGCGGTVPDQNNPVAANSSDNCAPGPGCISLQTPAKTVIKKSLRNNSSRKN